MEYLLQFITVVIKIVFGLFIFFVMARFILQVVRADFYNPVSQMFVKVTNPLLRPLRTFIPGFMGLDIAAIVLLLIMQTIELVLTHIIGKFLGGPGLHAPLLFSAEILGTLVSHAAQLFLICIIAIIAMSWISPGAYQNPLIQIATQIANPIMRPARKLLPAKGGIDFSPILALIFVFAVMFLIAAPLMDLPYRYNIK